MSRDKLKSLYLYYHSTNGHKTYQGADILRGDPNHKFGRPLNEVVL